VEVSDSDPRVEEGPAASSSVASVIGSEPEVGSELPSSPGESVSSCVATMAGLDAPASGVCVVEVSAPCDPLVWDWSEEGPVKGSEEVGDVFVVGSELSSSPGWSEADVAESGENSELVSPSWFTLWWSSDTPADGLGDVWDSVLVEDSSEVTSHEVGELDLEAWVDPVAGVWPKKPGSPTPPAWSGASSLSCGWVDRSSVFDGGVVVTTSAAGVGS